MSDLLFVALALAFFILSIGYVAGCDRLVGGTR